MSSVDVSSYPLGLLISIANRMLDGLLERAMQQAGFGDVRRAHGAVFEALDPEGSRLTEMAARAGMTKQAMGELVDYLEERGYLKRRSDSRDRRAKLVVLTAKGRRVVEAAQRAMDDMQREWTVHLGERRAHDLKSALASACNHLGRDHIR